MNKQLLKNNYQARKIQRIKKIWNIHLINKIIKFGYLNNYDYQSI